MDISCKLSPKEYVLESLYGICVKLYIHCRFLFKLSIAQQIIGSDEKPFIYKITIP